ncbi:hypothetical protein ACO34A_02290 [Rhizobium sp. ACO-34A]|nr:DUF2000 domain-containing protein [Rhizobium sp. ACO-34A]ATN32633.1 hypothetical protein ACO34A_02290 [Rhizobium sp. ACO-34A]
MTEDLRLAIVVNPDLPQGLLANTVGAIAIGIGAKLPVLAARQLEDRQGRRIDVSSTLPVPILQADAEALRRLLLKAQDGADPAGAVVPFPAFARALHVYADYETSMPDRDLGEEKIDGLGIAGPAKWVKSLTGALKLLR